jgi:hypothetical protein
VISSRLFLKTPHAQLCSAENKGLNVELAQALSRSIGSSSRRRLAMRLEASPKGAISEAHPRPTYSPLLYA